METRIGADGRVEISLSIKEAKTLCDVVGLAGVSIHYDRDLSPELRAEMLKIIEEIDDLDSMLA